MPAANARSYTALGGICEAVLVLGIFEVRSRFCRIVTGSQTQVLVYAIRIDQLAGVHLPIRIPDGLEFAERLDHLLIEHPGQQFAAGLPIAVLARERSSVADDYAGGFAEK